MIGTRLGPYEITAKLGEGGMGEVYRATDTKLRRDVAIKVLPAAFTQDRERLARFEREAQLLAQLHHPNIASIFGLEESAGTRALVMELVEGPTLAERLEAGSIPLDESLSFARQIAEALEAAHEKGIVHRDLKPQNIKASTEGKIKVLDFGLAKAMDPTAGSAASAADLARSPTLLQSPTLTAMQGTQLGVILGTVAYMAPEQARGGAVDKRADIWAFGVVLYEMLSGTMPFAAETLSDTLAAVLTREVDWRALPASTPPSIRQLLQHCLERNPRNRLRDIGDARLALDDASRAPAANAAPPRPGQPWAALPWILLAITVGAGSWAVVTARAAQRLAVALPTARHLALDLADKSAVRALALFPDGTRLALAARDASGRNLLWIRDLDLPAFRALPGTENPSFPFWSPDGRFLGFFAEGKLKRIDAAGGPAQTLCDAPIGRGGSWSREGIIVFAPLPDSPIFQVSAAGGTPEPITRLDPARGESSHRWPAFLPDGRRFVYEVASFGAATQPEKLGIYAGSLAADESPLLVRASSSVAYVAGPDDPMRGDLLFVKDGNLMAQGFDAEALSPRGDAHQLAEDVQVFPQSHSALFSVSNNGMLVFASASGAGVSQLAWFDRAGSQLGTLGGPGVVANPRISPDGKRVAVDIIDRQTGNDDLWVYETGGGLPARLTSNPGFDNQPVWSPDGGRIVFTTLRNGHGDLYFVDARGGAEQPLLRSADTTKYATDWSPDGRSILYRAVTLKSNFQLWAVAPGGGESHPFIKAAFGVSHGQFSPDGQWVAYASNESGKWEIYVTSFPEPRGNWKVSSAGGSEPRWRRDGNELFYLSPDGEVMEVQVRRGAGFDAEPAQPLFHPRLRQHISSADLFTYDVAPDGQRFLVNTDVGEATGRPLTVLINWRAPLTSRSPR
jgi:Tol biopolymer transport system component